MSLEVGTFINDLVVANPPGTDPIQQGDDHLRLIKSVLKNTIPNADKAFYFPDAATKSANYTILKADINKFFSGDASGGAFNLTLPTLAAGDDGWYVTIQKTDSSANAVNIVGTINGVSNLSINTQYRAAVVWWSGTAWFAYLSPPPSLIAATAAEAELGSDTAKYLTPDASSALWKQGSDVASATTVTFGDGGYFNITGTTTITAFAFTNDKSGRNVWVKFGGALTLTHNATSLILPSGGNVTTVVGDTACFVSLGSGNFRCVAYPPSWAGSSGVPAGSVFDYAGSSAPSGWLLCDGAAVSRTTYAALFTAISTTFGAGDGSTTFNVPDLRGRVSLGVGTGAIAETQPAANFNVSDTITVTSNVDKWTTGMKVQVTTTGVLPTGITAATDYFVRRTAATTIELYDTLAHAIDTGSTSGRVNITATGSGNHTLTYALSTRTLGQDVGEETHGLVVGEIPAHTHNIGSAASGGTYSNASANRDLGLTSGLQSTTSIGGSGAHNNMPPALVLNKIIKT